MNFKDILEQIQFELILEGLGMIFGIALLWKLIFHPNIHLLLSLFITTIC